jgi:predicted tellurium resistance membrane protein TerC
MDLALFTHPDTLVSLLTLTAMEIVLGIDNIVFISILTGRLPAAQQAPARRLGLGLALIMRLGLLFAISWVMGLTTPLFSVLGHGFSGRHLILLGGGLFLIAKATHEIHSKLEGSTEETPKAASARAFGLILLQIMVLDLVFSLDSVITAVGMVDEIAVMVVAMVLAVGVMLAFAGAVGQFVHRHPSMKILALSFLLLIGVMLVAESIGQHIAKGTIYFAMAFSLVVELLNMRFRKRSTPVALHEPVDPGAGDAR